MEFRYRHRRQITYWLCLLFLILFIDRWWNGMFLSQLQPAFLVSRMDLFTWLLMYTGVQHWLLNNPTGWLLFDALFTCFPLLYLLCFTFRASWAPIIAWLWLLNNWLYVQCYTLYPSNSVEGHLCWLLMPLLFTCTTLKSFYLVLHFLRYFFLWFMVSAGLWKIWQQGIFNYDQMSAILYAQHKEFMVTSPASWLTHFYYWIIQHPVIGQGFYMGSCVIELCFAIGFFTRRFDRPLVVLYFLFFVMDVLVMRIKYWEMAPFIVVFFTLLPPFHKTALKRPLFSKVFPGYNFV